MTASAKPARPRGSDHRPHPGHAHGDGEPSPWIVRFASLIAPQARVLDLASGRGRHARWLAARGIRVMAVDRDGEALAMLDGAPGITTRVCDLEQSTWPLAGEHFDAVVVVNYLHRPTFERLLDTIADDGVLLYETFMQGNERYGRPSNPDFLLMPGELLARTRDRMQPVAFEQGLFGAAGQECVLQRIAAVGRAPLAMAVPCSGRVRA